MSDPNNANDWIWLTLNNRIVGDYMSGPYPVAPPQWPQEMMMNVTSGTPMPHAWLRERKRYCLDQKQSRIVPVVKPTLLDQWLAGRKS